MHFIYVLVRGIALLCVQASIVEILKLSHRTAIYPLNLVVFLIVYVFYLYFKLHALLIKQNCKFNVVTFTYFVVNKDVTHRSIIEKKKLCSHCIIKHFRIHCCVNEAFYNSTSINLHRLLRFFTKSKLHFSPHIGKHFFKISFQKKDSSMNTFL